MRDYGSVSPKFWLAGTGRELRGDPEAQVVALYLMTSPHATMTGVYHVPRVYIAHETGMPLEVASKALRRLIEAGFCAYDEATETVFVYRMAAYQVAEALKPSDKRVKAIRREVEQMPQGALRTRFLQIYGDAFHVADMLTSEGPSQAPSGAPPKPLRSQEQ